MRGEVELRRVHLPVGRPVVPPSWAQLGVLVMDGSKSMTLPVHGLEAFGGTKAQAANVAVRGLFSRFAGSARKANFHFAVVTFTEKVTHVLRPTAVDDLDPFGDYDPTAHGTGGTFLGSGLEQAGRLCDDFLSAHQTELPASAVVLLLTDGECGDPDRTARIAATLRANPRVTVAGAYFATKGGSAEGALFLQGLCTDPVTYYTTVYDPETLRKFWTASLQTAARRTGLATGE